MSSIAETPRPPYYVVLFTTLRTEVDDGYSETSKRMEELAKQQDGFLGLESARDGVGITASYWRDLKAIENWKNNLEHTEAREKGRAVWYASYKLRIAKVEHDYAFEKE